MDDVVRIKERIKNKRNNQIINKDIKSNGKMSYISKLFSRTLLSIILILLCAIYVNYSDENLIFFKEKMFNDNLAFTKINNLYSKYFGDVLVNKVSTPAPVFNETSKYESITNIDNYYQLKLTSNTYSFLESGIIVFCGEKENLGNTIIVQGVDGTDIWYSNLLGINVSMYDYVSKDDIIGEVKDNTINLTFIENGEYISYDKYIS